MGLFEEALGKLNEVVELLEVQRWWEEEGSGWAEIVGWLEEMSGRSLDVELEMAENSQSKKKTGGKKFHH